MTSLVDLSSDTNVDPTAIPVGLYITNNLLSNVFPSPNSIPPPTFYTMQGLAKWLNQNQSYKSYFIGYTAVSPYLISTTSTLSSIGYLPENVSISPTVKTLSQSQLLLYSQQLCLFQKVYAFNSTAYGNYATSGTPPAYFRFQTYKDYTNFKSAVAMVNKMYPFDAMANGTDPTTGATLGWVVPFPL